MGLEQEKEPRYQVTYSTYLATGGRLSYTPSVECVIGWRYVKHSLLTLQISPFYDYVMLTWEKIPGSPRFFALQATESWAELNEERGYDNTNTWNGVDNLVVCDNIAS